MTICLVFLLFFAAPAPAQTRDPELGQKVLGQAIQALGGQAYLNVRDRRAEGRAFQFSSREELSGMARIINYEKFPDKYRQEIGKDKEVVFVLNGEHGWEGTFRGVREMLPEEVEPIRLRRELSVDHLLRFRFKKEEGLEIAHIGTDLVDGRTADLVEVVDAQNRVVTIAFDQSSHLPLRREWERRNPKTNEREQNVEILSKYLRAKGSGAVLEPYYIHRERNGIKVFESFLTEVTVSAKLPDSLFERPPGPEWHESRRR